MFNRQKLTNKYKNCVHIFSIYVANLGGKYKAGKARSGTRLVPNLVFLF